MNSSNPSYLKNATHPRYTILRVTVLPRLAAFLTALFILPLLVFGQTGQISFAVIGDYGDAGTGERNVSNLVHGWNPDLIITVGDNNYPDGEASTIDENIGQYFHDFIFPYTGIYGPGATTNRFFPSPGNHDWHAAGLRPYIDYFRLPGNERYYDFVSGPVHFFAIDSDSAEPDGNTSSSVQAIWLRNALASSPEPWKIVYFHHPPYSSGHHGSTTRMRWPFKDWGASAVLSGHDHTYERLNVNGLTYFIDGLGGSSRYAFETILAESQVRYNANYGAILVNADSDSITFQFYNISGTLIDTTTLSIGNPSGINPPNGLQANAVTVDRVNLSWNDNSDNETGFDIERCATANCTNFARIAQVGTDVESYSDTITAVGDYRYRVRAFNATANSVYSNIANVTTSEPSDVFTDNFDDGVIDRSKWNFGLFSRDISYVDPQVSVSEQNGTLDIAPDDQAQGPHYNGIKSAGSWDMNDSAASVEIVSATDNRAATIFAVGTDKNNWLAFRAKDDSLYIERRVASVTTREDLKFDPVADRFWRIRHDPASDTIVFETSPDGNNWILHSTSRRPFRLDSVRFELSAGTSGAIAGPGEAAFDNFRLEHN